MEFLPINPEKLFPRKKVEERQFQSWKEHPVTEELVRELSRRIYELNMGALFSSGTPEDFHVLKGQAEAYRILLRWMSAKEIESQTPETQTQEENESD